MAVNNIFGASSIDDLADNVLGGVDDFMLTVEKMQKRKVASNVQLVVQALKKIESDLQDKYDGVTTVIEKRVASIKDGKDGQNGANGRDGKDGRPGRDGAVGPRGADGLNGRNGLDGEDGVSVTDARIDFDGSLVISLSSGREINVGEVVAPDLADKIKVITNGGGTSQGVLDTLTSLQNQITALGGLGAVNYVGTWNASTNTPTIVASTGDKGDYYVVSVAGSTSINGQTLWGVGDWIIFNGAVWQRVDGGSTGNFTDLTTSGTVTHNGGTANGVAYLNTSKVLTTGTALTFDGTNLGIGGDIQQPNSGYLRGKVVAGVDTRLFGINGSNNLSIGSIDIAIGDMVFVNSSEQMRLTSTGLGIGTSSPTARLTVSATSGELGLLTATGASNYLSIKGDTGGTTIWNGIGTDTGVAWVGSVSNHPVSFRQNNAERMRLTSTGLGIGTSSPTQKLDVLGSIAVRASTSGANQDVVALRALNSDNSAYANAIYYGNSQRWCYAGATEGLRLDSSGNLLVGTTTAIGKVTFTAATQTNLYVDTSGVAWGVIHNQANAGTQYFERFDYAGTQIGSIQGNNTATSYNTSSDYRLKNITGPITTSGAYIDSLNPVEGTWKADGSTFVGLIAHEVQEASRTTVATGVKDGEQMQGMDYSSAEIIANLIAEVKSLRQRLAALESI